MKNEALIYFLAPSAAIFTKAIRNASGFACGKIAGRIYAMGNYLAYLEGMRSSQTSRRKIEYIRHNFGDYFAPGQSILEIGPGLGEFLEFAGRLKSCSLDIIERDAQILAELAKRYSLRNTWCTSLEELIEDHAKLPRYDRIFMLQVLEHVEPHLLVPVMRLLYQHLNPGGSIILTVPNGGNPLAIVERYSDLTHHNVFSENSLRQLVQFCALEGAETEIFGYRIPPSSALNVVRIGAQKILHWLLLGIMVANGGVFSRLLQPNICLVLKRKQN